MLTRSITKHPFCLILFFLISMGGAITSPAQESGGRDSIRYRIIYRDTIVYRYDTVHVKRYIYTDTLMNGSYSGTSPQGKRKGWYNPTSWGIGPSLGTYYSPYHGFDLNIGFGVQYYLFAVPSFRNPHMGHHKKRK